MAERGIDHGEAGADDAGVRGVDGALGGLAAGGCIATAFCLRRIASPALACESGDPPGEPSGGDPPPSAAVVEDAESRRRAVMRAVCAVASASVAPSGRVSERPSRPARADAAKPHAFAFRDGTNYGVLVFNNSRMAEVAWTRWCDRC